RSLRHQVFEIGIPAAITLMWIKFVGRTRFAALGRTRLENCHRLGGGPAVAAAILGLVKALIRPAQHRGNAVIFAKAGDADRAGDVTHYITADAFLQINLEHRSTDPAGGYFRLLLVCVADD